jgi:hypothetical protein
MTPRTGDLVTGVFPTVDMRDDLLGEAPGELLAQGPHRLPLSQYEIPPSHAVIRLWLSLLL